MRSSLAELHRGVTSPSGSFRSPSRFFSFLGTTLSTRWERPPPTYDEAMKHINPDLVNQPPPNPPAYTDTINGRSSNLSTFSTGRRRLGRGYLRRHRSSSSSIAANGGNGMIQTPPPEYQSQESGLHRLHLELDLEGGATDPLNPNSNDLPPRAPPSNFNSSGAAGNRRRTRQEERERGNGSRSLTTSRSSNRIRYARYDRASNALERSSNSRNVTRNIANSPTNAGPPLPGLLPKIHQHPNVIILPPASRASAPRSNDALLSASSSHSSSASSIPDLEFPHIPPRQTNKIKDDQRHNEQGNSSSPTKRYPSEIGLCEEETTLRKSDFLSVNEEKDDDYINDPSFLSSSPPPPSSSLFPSSIISLTALSNSSDIVFPTDDSQETAPGSPQGSTHSHLSNDSSTLSSSSEASIKTVVNVNSAAIKAEICNNEGT